MIPRPSDLSPELAALWGEYEPQMHPRIGSAGMEALVSAVIRLRRARDRVDKEGELVQDAKGNPGPHPALLVEKMANVEIRAWVAKFGIIAPRKRDQDPAGG